MAAEVSVVDPFEIVGSDSIITVSVTEIGASSSAKDVLENDKISRVPINRLSVLMAMFVGKFKMERAYQSQISSGCDKMSHISMNIIKKNTYTMART